MLTLRKWESVNSLKKPKSFKQIFVIYANKIDWYFILQTGW
jgi:hypothetical protein